MNFAELRQVFYARLTDQYDQGELQALYHWVAGELQGWCRAQAYQHNDDALTPEALERWEAVILRLQRQEPVQYIFQKASFCELELYVDERVLIPRPETEELVELVLKHHDDAPIRVLDVGTGSGCIALALKKARPDWQVSGWDVSEGALEVARRNASDLHLEVDFAQVDVLSEWPEARFDVIVSNPPYIPAAAKSTMDERVWKYEPNIALMVTDEKPWVFYERIAYEANAVGAKSIYFETHAANMNQMKDQLQINWSREMRVVKDLSNKDRFLVLTAS